MITIEKNNVRKKLSTGFSWKYLLFGTLYPLARGDYKGFFICLAWTLLTFGAALLVIPFNHNKKALERFQLDGWKVLY